MKRHSQIAGAALLASLMIPFLPTASAQGPCQVIGTISVSGSKAFRNDEKLKKNARNVPLCNGDEVRTGTRSSAVIRTPANQTVQTDQNTSLFAKIGGGITQLLLWLQGGQAVVVGEDVGITTADLSADLGSTVNVRVDDAGSTLTVIDGHAAVTRPTNVMASANERYVANDGMAQHYRISPDEARRSVDWTKNYFKPSSSFLKKFLIAAGIVVAGVAIHEATDDDDHQSGQPSSPSDQPYPSPPQDEARTPTPEAPPPSPTVVCCKRIGDGWGTIMTPKQDCQGIILASTNDLCPPVR